MDKYRYPYYHLTSVTQCVMCCHSVCDVLCHSVCDVLCTLGASLWGPLKELWETVEGAVMRRQSESVHLLDLQLKKHKPHFLSLYKNPVCDV